MSALGCIQRGICKLLNAQRSSAASTVVKALSCVPSSPPGIAGKCLFPVKNLQITWQGKAFLSDAAAFCVSRADGLNA